MRTTRLSWAATLAVCCLLALPWPAGAGSKNIRKPVDWPALNPAFAGATFVNDPTVCETCHDEGVKEYKETPHALALGSSSMQCESCHGPRSKHVENPTRELAFAEGSRGQAAVCLQCHDGGTRMGWKAGAHQANDINCTSCHVVMEKRSTRALLVEQSSTETCATCHRDTRTQFNKSSHHPVREGKMECASCHNVHGATQSLLVKATVNDTCFSCHTEKRGPYVWEHAPVRESCSTCHTPHGSNQRSLLTGKDSFLCLTCHSYGGHINLPRYNRVSNPYGNGCVNCHTSVHGSNHPSGAKLTR